MFLYSEFFLPQYHLCSFNYPDLEFRILELKIRVLRETFKTEAPFVRHNSFLGVLFTHCLLLPNCFVFFMCISRRMAIPWAGMLFVSCSQHMVTARQVGQFALMGSVSGH